MDSDLKKIVLIGAGQLGSRHLQGVLKTEKQLQIYVIDPSEDSLALTQKRANEIVNQHKIRYSTDWNILPQSIDLAIIATTSDIREQITNRLINDYQVRNLLLEKVLFQEIGAYDRIKKVIDDKKVMTWVNHPRRYMKFYQDIKRSILDEDKPMSFQVLGGNWGLACNTLHFIDLFMFLADAELSEVDSEWLDDVIHPSKRANFIEFTGTVKGKLTNGSTFMITALNNSQEPISINILANKKRWTIIEKEKVKVIEFSKYNNYIEQIYDYEAEFVSNLTTQIVKDIFELGICNLPLYDEASGTHTKFINAILQKYNQLSGLNTTICPIT